MCVLLAVNNLYSCEQEPVPPLCQPHGQQSALECLGGHRLHLKTWMDIFWHGFAPSPPSLGSTDMPFISCPFYSATLRLQNYEEKEADEALHF